MKLLISPEQMAAPPTKPLEMPVFSRRSAVPFWVTIVAIVVPGFFLRFATAPRLVLVPWWIDLFSVPVVLIGGLFLSILIHEMGHLLAGRAGGMRIAYLIVGPFKVARTSLGWRILASGLTGFAVQGRVLAVPTEPMWDKPDQLRRALTWYFAGGPIITFLQTALLGALLFLTPDRTFGHVARGNLIALFLLSTMILAWVIYPLTVNEMPNDIMQIMRLRRRTPQTQRFIALLILQGQLVAGIRPRDLNDLALAQAQMVADGSSDHTAARLIALANAEDEGRLEVYAEGLTTLLKGLHELPPSRRASPLLWQAAYFEARYGEDLGAAQGWLALAAAGRNTPLVESWLLKYIADLSVALIDDSRLQTAAAAAAQVKCFLSYTHTPGAAIPVEEWISRLGLPLENQTPRLPWSYFWRPIGFSVLLTAMVVVAVTFFLVIVLIS